MNADGSNAHQLAPLAWGAGRPDFRPDGSRVAFAKTKDTSGDAGIYEVDLAGKVTDLVVDLSTSPSGATWSDSGPRWSPDGTKLAFSRDTWQGNDWVRADVYVADFGTSPPTSPPASPPALKGPFGVAGAQMNTPGDWSPDGTRIAFTSKPATGTASTYIMNADGTGLRRVCAGGFPTWSPDGQFLAFGNLGGIYRVLVDGTGLIQLTNKGFSPDW